MIKHEESLEKLWNYLISNQLDKAEEQYELVHQVLEEQEKKDELLELYRIIFNNFWSDNWTMGEYKLIESKIKALEEELK
jgi:hypothetical protein